MLSCFGNCRDSNNGFFLRNGAAVLEQIVASFNGNCNPIRTYSSHQLNQATDDFSRSKIIHWGCGYQLFKGINEDREISVQRFEASSYREDHQFKSIANEIAISSRMSSHNNVLKLLGCCLETELPILVYEFPANGNLTSFVDNNSSTHNKELPFETRLKIAIGLANASAYLNHGLSKMFVHRDIHRGQVFLDENYAAKLSSFQLSIAVPEGKTHVDADVRGTKGFGAPEAMSQGHYSGKSDVYDLGVVLFELLVEERCNVVDIVGEEEAWKGQVEASILREGKRAQKMEWFKLIESCLQRNPTERPDMIQVAKKLRFIYTIQGC